jgi:hypothetical protein
LNQKITIREGTRSRRVTKGDAFIKRTVNGALNDDPKAAATLTNLLRACGLIAEAPDDSRDAPRTQDDAAVVADFLARQQQAHDQLDGNGDDTSEPKEPEDRRDDRVKEDKTRCARK